jgi:protein O-mannosyl-transferase
LDNFFSIFAFILLFAAEFLAMVSRDEEACDHRVKAAELSSKDYSLVVSAATALRLLDRKEEAETWYRQVRTKFQY